MDYSNAPVSIAEVKSRQTRDSADWTPRDVLISLLRDIDAGRISPSSLIIGYVRKVSEPEGERTFTEYLASCKSVIEALGLIERIKFCLWDETS